MSKSLFTCKEHYIAYRKAWSAAVNSDRAKSKLVEKPHPYYPGIKNYKEREPGWLTSAHMLLNNILRNKPTTNGFTPIHKMSRLQNGHPINLGFYQAVQSLKYAVSRAKKSLENPDSYHTERVNEFLEPFDGLISREMLAQIEVPLICEFSLIYSTKARVIASQMIQGRKFTMEELLPHMTYK